MEHSFAILSPSEDNCLYTKYTLCERQLFIFFFLAFNTRRAYKLGEAIIYITVKTMPEMLRKLIPKDVNPAFLCTSYSHNKEKYNKALKLSEKEQQLLSNLSTYGFQKCDSPLLFKLCQYFDFVTAPTKGWGKFVDTLDNMGDVVEALVRLRYEIVRNPTEDLGKRFEKLVEIAKVVDKEISTENTFEDAVKSLFVDDSSIEKCKTAFQQIVEEGKLTFLLVVYLII